MKLKISLLLSILFMALVCPSCSDDDDPGVPSLNGTCWSAELSSYGYLIIEFRSDTEVVGYCTNAAGGVSGSVSSGRYSFDGTRVVFSDFTMDDLMGSNHYVDGLLEGDIRLVLNYWWEWGGTRYDDTVSLRRL